MALMAQVVERNRSWRGAALLLILGALVILALFLTFRPLQLESPASRSARTLLRLDNALGATVEPVDARTARMIGLASTKGDLVVTSVASHGPAAQAGMRVGDVIERIGDRPASEVHAHALSMSSTPVLIIRGGNHAMLDLDFGGASRG